MAVLARGHDYCRYGRNNFQLIKHSILRNPNAPVDATDMCGNQIRHGACAFCKGLFEHTELVKEKGRELHRGNSGDVFAVVCKCIFFPTEAPGKNMAID